MSTLDPRDLDRLSPVERAHLGIQLARALLGLAGTLDRFRTSKPLPPDLEGAVSRFSARRIEGPHFVLVPSAASFLSGGRAAAERAPFGVLERLAKVEGALPFLAEVAARSPTDPRALLRLLAVHPELEVTLARAARMFGPGAAGSLDEAQAALDRDLQPEGGAQALRGALLGLGLEERAVTRFFRVFAEVRAGFGIGAQGGDDMQRTNWIHTRFEVLRIPVLAARMGLGPEEVEVALLGALLSDAFKDAGRHSLLWHNRAGAELIAPAVLGRHLDLQDPQDQRRLASVMRVVHEHQLTPPAFMAGAMRSALTEVVAGSAAEGRPERELALTRIVEKVARPLEAPARDGEILFDPIELDLLARAGLSGWAVPAEGPWRRSTTAAIVSDVAQYVSWEGILKIAIDLRDPGAAAPFLRDPVLSSTWLERVAPKVAEGLKAIGQGGAIESSLGFSFGEGLKVIADPAALEAMESLRRRTTLELSDRVLLEIERRLRAELGVPPGAPTPPIPYWNRPITEPGALGEDERSAANRVKRIAEGVMAEAGQVQLDPFATKGGAR